MSEKNHKALTNAEMMQKIQTEAREANAKAFGMQALAMPTKVRKVDPAVREWADKIFPMGAAFKALMDSRGHGKPLLPTPPRRCIVDASLLRRLGQLMPMHCRCVLGVVADALPMHLGAWSPMHCRCVLGRGSPLPRPAAARSNARTTASTKMS